jgi:hypothetical protein
MPRTVPTILALLLLAFTLSAHSQTITIPKEGKEVSLSQVMKVRERLIKKYVLGTHQLKAVSACGEDDIFSNDTNFLCVYAYRDSVRQIMRDLFDGEPNMRIDGVRVLVEVVDRKQKAGN